MTREELIEQCRYYKGEKEYPFDDPDMNMFWYCEQQYVRFGGVCPSREWEGLWNNLAKKDYPGIPREIIYFMFHYWADGAGGVAENIDKFHALLDEYIRIPNLHYPENEIPSNKNFKD